MASLELAVNSSFTIRHTLTNPEVVPPEVNDATVTARILNKTGAEIPGISQPITLDFEAGSKGVYSKVSDPVDAIVAGASFTIEISATGTDSLKGFWADTVKAGVQRG